MPEVGHPRGWNRYGYVYGNPVKYTDPSGHCYGIASGLRNTFYAQTCENLDLSYIIRTSPDTTIGQKVGAAFYSGAVYGSHLSAIVGASVASVGCLTGAGTVVCTGAGTVATTASADGDPTNETRALQGVIERGFGGNQELYKQFMQQ